MRATVAQTLRFRQNLFCIISKIGHFILTFSFFTPYLMQMACQKSPSSPKSRFSAKKLQLRPFQAPHPIQKITCLRFKSNDSEDFFETACFRRCNRCKRCKALHRKSTKNDHYYSNLNYFMDTKPNIPYTKTTAPLTRCRCFFLSLVLQKK